MTLGARGVHATLADAAATLYDAPRVKAVDTTAAGDTFIGGFAAQLAQGASVDQAIRFAQRAAALSVTRAGAQPSIPTRAELDASGLIAESGLMRHRMRARRFFIAALLARCIRIAALFAPLAAVFPPRANSLPLT